MDREWIEASFPRENETFDVVVAGGGPAGIGAALASAMTGAKTLLLEGRAFFGGVAAVSGWMPMNRLFTGGQSRGGAVGAFAKKILDMGPDASRPGKTSWVDGDGLHIHPDYLRMAAMELLEAQGCKYLLHSAVTDVEMDGARIRGLVCGGKYTPRAHRGTVYVDATGDGDVAFKAGAPMASGREEDGMFMPVTLGFVLAGVDEDRLYAALEANPSCVIDVFGAEAKNGASTSNFYSFDRTTIPGIVSVNNGGQIGLGVIDAMNIVHRNIAERAGMQLAMDFIRIARAHKLPGLENCRLARVGADLGVRETRRIVGKYVLTLKDSQSGVEFPDVVARRYGTIDPGGLSEDRNYHGSIKSGHAYPYRCLLPKGIKNLLVAGRCASLTHLGLTACKSMGNMMAIGQAAGVAAAIGAKAGSEVEMKALDVGLVQKALRGMGVEL